MKQGKMAREVPIWQLHLMTNACVGLLAQTSKATWGCYIKFSFLLVLLPSPESMVQADYISWITLFS